MELTDSLKDFLIDNGYFELKEIDGVIVALHDFMTTRAIVVGLDRHSVGRRYCYQHRGEANQALQQFTDPSRHPTGNWIKLKGVYQGKPVDIFNPAFTFIES